MGKTKIEWTDATWNPVRGCTRISEGCRHCYAERMAARFCRHIDAIPGPRVGQIHDPFHGFAQMTPSGPRWTGRVELIESQLEIPLRWKKPRRIFVNSMSDTFHEALPDEAIDRIFAVMALCPQHTFMVLTKRADRMRAYCSTRIRWANITEERDSMVRRVLTGAFQLSRPVIWPLPNVRLGVSVEDRSQLHRIDSLRETPAALRFLSLEPLLEDLGELDLRGIGWVIIGGESGPGARPMNPAWARSVRDQCRAAGVSYFHKQNGEWLHNEQQGSGAVLEAMLSAGARGATHRWSDRGGDYSLRIGKRAAGRLLDGRTWDEMPEVTP